MQRSSMSRKKSETSKIFVRELGSDKVDSFDVKDLPEPDEKFDAEMAALMKELDGDELSRVVRHLETKAPQAKDKLCANKGCVFYIEMLVACALKRTGGIPPHSCLGVVGPFGAGDFEGEMKRARKVYAEELKKRHPELFNDMK